MNPSAFVPVHSSTPYPIHSGMILGTIVDAGTVPRWMAEIVHNIHVKIVQGRVPTLEEIERKGGYEPISFLDFIAGGLGDGSAANAVLERRSTSLVREIGYVGQDAAPASLMTISTLALPFPVTGARVTDGAVVGPGTIPEWMARIAYDQMLKAAHTQRVALAGAPSLEEIRREGGFKPEALLDFLAGGSGSGHAFLAVVRRRPVEETPLGAIITATKKTN